MRPIGSYKTLVFDCDGVVLDSNQLKTQAYFVTAMSHGATQAQAQALVDHHVKFGGISRYPKYELFLRDIMHEEVTDQAMKKLLDKFAEEIRQGLLVCKVAPGLEQLREATENAKWMMVSGGDQSELRALFKERGLDHFFDAGIFGSPDNKDAILPRELASGNLIQPAVFFGDSLYDHEAATRAGLDFVFVSHWTEFSGWEAYCKAHHIDVIADLEVLA
jgi:phosphoglycolate phosphatase-like HAD superfamily hydrolase